MGTSAQARDQSAPLLDLPELQFQSSLPDSRSEHTEDIADIMICRYRAAPIAFSYEPRGEVLFTGGVWCGAAQQPTWAEDILRLEDDTSPVLPDSEYGGHFRHLLMRTSPDLPGRVSSSDETEDSSRSSTRFTVPDDAAVRYQSRPATSTRFSSCSLGGHFGHFIFICCFQSVFIFEDPAWFTQLSGV